MERGNSSRRAVDAIGMSTEFAASPRSNFLGLAVAGEAPASANDERRRSHRESYSVTAWLSPDAQSRNGKQRQVLVTNLSLHGAGFVASTPLEIEAIHWIVVGAGALRASSRIRIVSCRPKKDGGFEVGGEFF
jgi:hypothetical protein